MSPELPPTLGAIADAPLSFRIFLIGGVAAFGGIFAGYDGGYMGAVLGMKYFIQIQTGLDPETTPPAQFAISAKDQSVITTILPVGQIVGSFLGGELADRIGRRLALLIGSACFVFGVVLQTINFYGLSLLVAGRFFAGAGVGLVAGVVVLYIAETCPKKIRGAMVAGYQFFITVGILIATCVGYATQDRMDSLSFRLPIGLQIAWGLILIVGMLLMPETPRYKVQKGKVDEAAKIIATLRSQPVDSHYVQTELEEIVQNWNFELALTGQLSYWNSWFECFKGKLSDPASNIRRTLLGFLAMMFGQLSGISLVIYFGTVFFIGLRTSLSPFSISIIVSGINMAATIISFWTIDRFGRRPVLLAGYAGMGLSQLGIAIVGTVTESETGRQVIIALMCVYVAFFAACAGPVDFVLVAEIFPLTIRSRGLGISVSSAWFWSIIVSVITPYLIGADAANLGPKVCCIFGGFCVIAFVFVYFMVPELKGLSLENVELVMRECTPRQSAKWRPPTVEQVVMATEHKDQTDDRIEVVDAMPTVAHRAV